METTAVLTVHTAVVSSSVPSAREPEAIYKVFGRRLRELREKVGMPQEELATLSGLTRSSIANIENGKQRIMLHQLVQFAQALQTEVGSLIPSLKAVEPDTTAKMDAYLERLRQLTNARPRRGQRHEKKKS